VAEVAQSEVITRDDFVAFQQQVADFAQAQARELHELKQRAAQSAQQAQQPPLPPDVDDKLDNKLREEIQRNPRRYTAEVVAIAKKQARDDIMAEIQRDQLARDQQAAVGAFWSQFYGYNTDLQAWQGEIARHFSQTNPDLDLSLRANWAADQVRAQLGETVKAMRAQEERQKRGARQAASAPGNMALPPMAQDAQVSNEPERVSAKDALIDAISEHEAARAKRMWDKIDTPDYRAAARDRAARVVLQRSA
jgi:hypothetical protein